MAQGIVHDTIYPGAKVFVTIKYGLITLLREKVDICDHSGEVNLECPIERGQLVLVKDVEIPSKIPPVSLLGPRDPPPFFFYVFWRNHAAAPFVQL